MVNKVIFTAKIVYNHIFNAERVKKDILSSEIKNIFGGEKVYKLGTEIVCKTFSVRQTLQNSTQTIASLGIVNMAAHFITLHMKMLPYTNLVKKKKDQIPASMPLR